jgi:hypothetical protein
MAAAVANVLVGSVMSHLTPQQKEQIKDGATKAVHKVVAAGTDKLTAFLDEGLAAGHEGKSDEKKKTTKR